MSSSLLTLRMAKPPGISMSSLRVSGSAVGVKSSLTAAKDRPASAAKR
ncbi:hypothetical protein ACQUJS_10860 [Ralstonia pseudosolanacearum]